MGQSTTRHLRLKGSFSARAQPDSKIALGQFLDQVGQIIVQPVVAGIGDDLVQVLRDGANIFVDAPFIVIEDADEFLGGMGNIVQRLK